MIEYKNYGFQYVEAEQATLKNINLKVKAGEVILLTGRSGCGKTTLIRTLNRLIPHFYQGTATGELNLAGNSIMEAIPEDLVGKIGSVFQDPRSQFFMTDTTRELAFGCQNLGLQQAEVAEKVQQSVHDLDLFAYLNRSIFHLSSGEKQQIAIGSIYAMKPTIYIFDEPSANLDYQTIRRLSEIILTLKEQGCTIFIVEHRFYYLRDLLDWAYLMADGKIVRRMTRAEFCQLERSIREKYGLRTVYPEEEAVHFPEKIQPPQQPVNTLDIQHVSYGYKRSARVLKDVNLHAESGDVIGILGENGAGKTTLLSILTGLSKQQQGVIKLNNKILTVKQRQKLSSMVMQDADYQLFSSSVMEELSLGMKDVCQEKVAQVLEDLDLVAVKDQHPAALSGGQKQRVTIGAAIVRDSPLIYFDEPTSGLDFEAMVRVSRLIKKLSAMGKIIFIVSHDFEFITRTCQKMVTLENGLSMETESVNLAALKSLSEKFLGGEACVSQDTRLRGSL